MKIKVVEKSYEEVINSKDHKPFVVKKPNILFRTLLKVVSQPDLWSTKFSYTTEGMEKLDKKEPCIILMNHSSFIDLEIAQSIFYPRPLNIVTTTDGFVGKNWLMRQIGCIPTPKFVSDPGLVRSLAKVIKMKSSVLMYPEASYSFDGTATMFPKSVAKFVKFLKVPVVTCITDGAFLRQPLYNELRKRKVKVTAHVKYLISKEELQTMSEDEVYAKLVDAFSFDNFRNQQVNKVKIDFKDRAVGLNKVLYKCPHCNSEEHMTSNGDEITCTKCGVTYKLDEYGYLKCMNNTGLFDHIPTWYKWQREEAKKELLAGTYKLDEDVEICMMKDTYNVYKIGDGHLTHTNEGFHLVSDDGKLDFKLPAINSYSTNSDYFWYELGDMVSIGDYKKQFYCFMKSKKDVVAKTRIATEELFKILIEDLK